MCLALQVGGLADIDTPIIGAGLSDLQGQYSLLAEHAETSIFPKIQAILEPGNLRLYIKEEEEEKECILMRSGGRDCSRSSHWSTRLSQRLRMNTESTMRT